MEKNGQIMYLYLNFIDLDFLCANTEDIIIFTRPRRHAVILNTDIISILNQYLHDSFSPININAINSNDSVQRSRTESPRSITEI